MNARLFAIDGAPEGATPFQHRGERSLGATIVALATGALATIAPIAALLVLALLGARALIKGETIRIDAAALAGPAFATAIVGAFTGLAGAIGAVFVWRLFSDVRWSMSEATRLALAAGRPGEATMKALAHGWLTPAYCLALVAYTAPHMVAGLPLDLPHLPLWVVLATGGVAALGVCDWLLQRAADWRLGELGRAPALHLACHHLLLLSAFGSGLDVSAGLVAMIAWRLAYAAPLAR